MRDLSYMSDKYRIKVAIIEDDETIRKGYDYLINADPSCKVIATYSSAEEALKRIAQDDPDVILLDLGLPGMTGIQAIPRLKNAVPDVQIIVLTVFESEEFIFDALTSGASGYLLKNIASAEVVASIIEVMDGGGPMSMGIARMVIESFQKNLETPLSKRETQILEEISEGKSKTRIARELFIDVETVKTHVKNIYSKLNVHSRADAINAARRSKFI